MRRNIPRNPEFSLATSDEDGMIFVQAGEIIAGFDSITRDTVLCFNCQHNGYYAKKCPSGAIPMPFSFSKPTIGPTRLLPMPSVQAMNFPSSLLLT